MNNNLDIISESLDTEEKVYFPPVKTYEELKDIRSVTRDIKNASERLDDDYDFARNNLIDILEEAMGIVPSIVNAAKESETPRQFEALSMFLKTVADLNKDLISISENQVKSNKAETPEKTIINQTAIFSGSTEDLLKKLFPRNGEN